MVVKLNGDIISDKTADFCLGPTLDASEGRMCGCEGGCVGVRGGCVGVRGGCVGVREEEEERVYTGKGRRKEKKRESSTGK